jgi:HSP20 family molecular chaperone IbpA
MNFKKTIIKQFTYNGNTKQNDMTYIRPFSLDQFDLLWRDFFNTSSTFTDLLQKVSHPTDIYETEEGIVFDVAAVGLNKEDIEILTEGDTLRITYQKKDTPDTQVIYKGIKKGSFDLGWKLASKFDLSKLTAKLDKGLLTISVPFSEQKQVKKVQIN